MRMIFVTVIALCTLAGARDVWGCPFCSAPSLTLSEQLAQADAAVLVQWSAGAPADSAAGDQGTTTYSVLDVVKAGDSKMVKGDAITVPRYREGRAGELFLLLGTQGVELEWSSPLEVTEASFNYIRQAPSPEAASLDRLAYFVRFLEYPDPLVANDAYAEFANAPYKDIVPLASQLPREQVRAWVRDPDIAPTRLGLYGLLLGLCGTPDDAQLMEQRILEADADFRLGIDGVMGGYLLLTGAEGLDLIDEQKLRNRSIPFSETYAAMQALRFMWTYAERIDKDRLRQSMRILLDRPELADLVIADLARWQDWSVMDQLMSMYDVEEYSIPSVKRAIVRYMLVASKDKPAEGVDGTHVDKGARYLATLRDRDPKTVQQAERFFFVN
jgi:hypothetical protein